MCDCATPISQAAVSWFALRTPADATLSARFDGGPLTSDGGLPWVAQAEAALGVCAALAAGVPPPARERPGPGPPADPVPPGERRRPARRRAAGGRAGRAVRPRAGARRLAHSDRPGPGWDRRPGPRRAGRGGLSRLLPP